MEMQRWVWNKTSFVSPESVKLLFSEDDYDGLLYITFILKYEYASTPRIWVRNRVLPLVGHFGC